MKISILDAQHTIFEGAVSEAILPATDGELSLLDDHEPIFVTLGKGSIRLKPLAKRLGLRFGPEAKEGEATKRIKPIPIHKGLARMRRNELVILVE